MTSKGFAVAASDVGGAFVKDLATELGKSASTLVAHLKKHLPTTLVKRKNANNRLANFCTADGVAGLRAHYTPTYAEVPNALVEELERLRDENKRLRALLTDNPSATVEELEQMKAEVDEKYTKTKERLAVLKIREREAIAESDQACKDMQEFIDYAEQKIQNNWRRANELRLQRTGATNTRVGGREAVVNREGSTVVSFKSKNAKDS